jgi:hypothetical protein
VNKKKNACMPSVRPSSFSLFLSPLLYPFSMCFPRQCRKATLNLYIRCERSDQPTTPFGQPTNPFPFYSRSTTIRIFIFVLCVFLSLIIFCVPPFQLAPSMPPKPQRSGVGGHSLLSLSIQLTPPGPLSCSAAFCV